MRLHIFSRAYSLLEKQQCQHLSLRCIPNEGRNILLFPDTDTELVPAEEHDGAGNAEDGLGLEAGGGEVALFESIFVSLCVVTLAGLRL